MDRVASASEPSPRNDDDGVSAVGDTSRRSDAGDGRCRRNPQGGAERRRIAASLVVAVVLAVTTPSSSLLALLAVEPRAAMGVFG